ncbi:Gx transporter family protein [Pseudoflavonifractor gallinarum]|uniref:Gx transporter family protein n=1 Tax=Eubacteriales TaxID=186802 RepID=UPI0025704FE4|nr:Gx transporter family protein [Clostridium sp. J1101437_171009_A5]
MKSTRPAYRLAMLSLLTAVALIIFVIEAGIPPLTTIPGIKMGLSNIITLVTMVLFGRREALLVLLSRIFLGSLFAGQMMTLLYSLSGGLLCFVVCAGILPFLPVKRLWLMSMIGAVFHNIGQIAMAIFITSTPELLWYLPVLLVSGLISGCFTGWAAQFVLFRLKSGPKSS